MAFTTQEFVNGALLAWGLVLLLLPGLLFAALSVGACPSYDPSVPCSTLDVSSRIIGAAGLTVAGAVASVPTFLLFVLPAYSLNRVWEGDARPAVHIAVNSLMGLAVGAVGSAGALAILGVIGLFSLALPVVLGSALAAAIALPLAWRLTAARALNADRGSPAGCVWKLPKVAS